MCQNILHQLKVSVSFLHVWEDCEYVKKYIILQWLKLSKEWLVFDATSTKGLATKKDYSWFIY